MAKRRNWKQVLLDQERSGLSITAYCKQHNISSTSFYQSRRRLRSAQSKPKTNFAEVRLQDKSEAISKQPKIRLHTPDGYIVEVYI